MLTELIAVAWLLGGGARGGGDVPPDYAWVVCEISDTCDPLSDNSCNLEYYCSPLEDRDSYYHLSRGREGLGCGEVCRLVEGMRLDVRCQEQPNGRNLTLYVNGTAAAAAAGDGRSVSWPFATAESAGGHYECRWDNGSSFGNRSVVVDGKNC